MKYKEIVKFNNINFKESMVNDVFISYLLNYVSPIFTKFFLKTKISPNQLTIAMIISGIIGSILFCIPNTIIKVFGIIFIWLWFILDHCDGEVARIKKQFSNFGKEIDYCAHVINHPLFSFSFLITILQITKNYSYSILFFLLISLNLMYRFYNCICYIYQLKSSNILSEKEQSSEMNIIKRYIIFFVNMFVHFPNYALIFPIFCIVNYKIALIYTIIVICVNLIYIPYLYFDFLNKIKNY